jgi:hypothetical protein
MLGRDKRKAKKAQISESEVADLKVWFKGKLEEVALLKTPDEQILKLEELRLTIVNRQEQKQGDIRKRSAKRGNVATFGILGAQTAAITGAVVASGGMLAPLLLLIPATPVVGMIGGVGVDARTEKNLNKANLGVTATLREQHAHVCELQENLLRENVEAIAQSPLRNQIFTKRSDLKSIFAEVAAQKIADDSAAKNENKKDPPQAGPKL